MHVRLPANIAPPNPDGSLQIKTYNSSSGDEQRYIDNVIDAWFFHKHRGILGTRVGKMKREFLTTIIKRSHSRAEEAAKVQGAAQAHAQKERRGKDLAIQIKNNPGYYQKYIQLYSGFHDGRYDLARKEAKNNMISAIKSGELQRAEVVRELDTQFLANDSTVEKPHWVTPRNYWEKDSNEILKVLRETENSVIKEQEAEQKSERDLWVNEKLTQIYDSKEPLTYTGKQDLVNLYMRTFQQSYEQVPDQLKYLYTLHLNL